MSTVDADPTAVRTRRLTHYSTPVEADELEFIQAIEAYKRKSDQKFLTWSEVLAIVRQLGYAKPAPPS